ncbi:MAG: hypothetical protein ACD_81C00190G0016 [uncultured bacterium]|uniref:DegT/DnrJ/EryC1/StrS aminotransferase n=1 Tax=Candidatus Wolfebacteria bacterium GW2011_GWC2_39_22 TaxID=1619013 RepID=A0A0G0QQE7_9BACT|nr:MAG: hypothetical protein ACD_81C00190G0016 [uncultured bacterium]KKR12590.1 MAG: DegT/DnrJ/EryC1/StrS aminotransferase [Candidatus Wolfebacteria bacterium GW2011_GWC2_39_22]HBI25791.1 lipopolysaccharide biosynthesis protein RfbH [Candidatus Wolfebacteria bacterium]
MDRQEKIADFLKCYFAGKGHEPKQFIPGVTPVPVSGKVYGERELALMIDAVLEGWWTEGKYTKEFEKRLAEFLGLQFCSVVNSGSSANLLALTALMSFRIPEENRVKKGDEVITVAAGFPTTINPIIQNGLVPVFVDVEMQTYNPSVQAIRGAISDKTKVVCIAHTLGNPFDVEAVRQLCDEFGLWLIEDNCDALGSKYACKFTGTFGHLSTCSFYPAHHITMGEGGAVLTDDPLLHSIVRSLRDWGRDCSCPTGCDNCCGRRFDWQLGDLPQGYDHKYVYGEIGYNLKATDIQAALGLAQLDRLPEFIQKRQENFMYLYHRLHALCRRSLLLPAWDECAEPSWFGFPITIRDGAGFTRTELLKFLESKKIGTRLLFAGNVTRQPYFKNYAVEHRIAEPLIQTDVIMNNTFWVGVYPGLTREMLDYIVISLAAFIDVRR